jgi:hypothetical protein
VLFKRPTKAFQDAVAKGGDGVRVLRIEGAIPFEGGFPIVMDGKIVGPIGISGDSSEHDAQCAKGGADALKEFIPSSLASLHFWGVRRDRSRFSLCSSIQSLPWVPPTVF